MKLYEIDSRDYWRDELIPVRPTHRTEVAGVLLTDDEFAEYRAAVEAFDRWQDIIDAKRETVKVEPDPACVARQEQLLAEQAEREQQEELARRRWAVFERAQAEARVRDLLKDCMNGP